MKSILTFALVLSTAMAAASTAALAQSTDNAMLEVADASLRITPQTLVQGQQFLVTFTPAAAESGDLTVHVAGQQLPMTRGVTAYLSYVALPADQKAGGYTLQVKSGYRVLASQKIEVRPGQFGTQNIRYQRPPVDAALQKKLDAEYALIDQARESYTPEKLWDQPFLVPVPHRISSVYGTRRLLNGKYNGYHGGVDFASPMGYPVKAPAAGKVVLANYFSAANANGNTVFLDHGMGVTTGYIHLSKINVKVGDLVERGQTIGLIGSTGRSTGPHLHWGTYIHGQNTDGLGWIRFTR